MAIYLQEYFGAGIKQINESFNPDLTESQVQTYIDENSLMVDIEAIHSKITRNCTYYSPTCLKDSVPYWTNPYEIPVIMHHNEKDGQIIGRVKAAEYTETETRSGTSALILTANIGNEEGKKGIKDGTLSTVSIGVIAHELTCSICGANLAEEVCEHERGETYDGKLCYWIINKMEPKEVSYVIVPSDKYAHNIRVYDAVKKKKSEVKESMENNIFAELIESTKMPTTKEGQQVDEEVKKEDKTSANSDDNKQPENTPEDNKTTEENSEKTPEGSTEDNKGEEAPKKEEPKDNEDNQSKEEGEKPEEKAPENKEEGEQKEDGESKENGESKSNTELEDAKKEIKDLKAKIDSLEKEKKKLETQLANTKEVKEAAEAELLAYRINEKKRLVEQINELRTSLSLPLENSEALMEMEEVELKANVKNLTEFTQVQKKAFGIQTLTSPVAVSESKDNTIKKTDKNVKESTQVSNNNLEQDILTIWNNIM